MLGPRLDPARLLAPSEGRPRLRRSLRWPHLVAMGVGAIVGTGIYTLIGIGAARAGPGVILAFAVAGLVCTCAALAYSELSTALPAAGSAYTYSYVALGESIAWVVGWSLVLEYSVACSAVASGWSAYVAGFLRAANWPIPPELLSGPHDGGWVNLPAVLIALAVTALLVLGARESARVNIVLVVLKLVALAVFVVFAGTAVRIENFEPFLPYGFVAHVEGGQVRGVMAAAAIVFFAFFGFDAVSTSAEEAERPERDLTIGIVGSMALCTLIYMAVAACAIGAWPYADFAASAEPLAHILRGLGHPTVATLVGGAAIIALPTVIMVMMYGQTRVFFVMARDGLLPRWLSRVHPRFGTPALTTVITGVFVASVAGFFRLDEIAELSNAGTLAAFVAVGASLVVLRRTAPDLARPFRCPSAWLVAAGAIGGCVYLFTSLPAGTQLRFLAWNAIGAAIYLAFGRRGARAAAQET